jgi:hypothetical protein
MNLLMIKRITYTIKFTPGKCYLNKQTVTLAGEIIDVLPNLEKLELYFESLDPKNRASLLV